MIGSFQLRVPILLPTGTKFKLKKVQYLSLWKEDSGEGASGRSGAAWVSSGGPSTGRAPASCSWLGAEPVLGQRLLASSAPDRAVCCNRAALFYNFSFGIWVIFSCACCILSSVLSSVPWLSSTCPALSTPSTCPHTHQLPSLSPWLGISWSVRDKGGGRGGASEHLTDSCVPGVASGTWGPQEGTKSESPRV